MRRAAWRRGSLPAPHVIRPTNPTRACRRSDGGTNRAAPGPTPRRVGPTKHAYPKQRSRFPPSLTRATGSVGPDRLLGPACQGRRRLPGSVISDTGQRGPREGPDTIKEQRSGAEQSRACSSFTASSLASRPRPRPRRRRLFVPASSASRLH